ncbi:MAG: helix-turn-helix transcriptional regulator [Candidatus Nanopelagicales bacterium]
MARMIDADDLIDANTVAEIVGLTRTAGVFVYQKRYAEMPRPVLDLGPHKVKLWSRSEIEAWVANRGQRRIDS